MGFSRFSFEHHSIKATTIGTRTWRTIGRPAWWQLLVSESDLADAVSILSSNPPASTQSDQDVGPLVSINFACAMAYDVAIVYFAVGWISLSRVRVFVFHRAAPGGGTLDSGALHIRFRPGDVQLLWADHWVALNMGYHNEHHDLPSIPWNNLPKLRAMAPEFYENLKYHSSWSRLLFQSFLTSDTVSIRESSG